MCLLVREREGEGRRERTVSPATPTNSPRDFAATSNIAHFKFSLQYVARAPSGAHQDLQFPHASPNFPLCILVKPSAIRRPLDSTVALRSRSSGMLACSRRNNRILIRNGRRRCAKPDRKLVPYWVWKERGGGGRRQQGIDREIPAWGKRWKTKDPGCVITPHSRYLKRKEPASQYSVQGPTA